jgi:hypothetical protein
MSDQLITADAIEAGVAALVVVYDSSRSALDAAAVEAAVRAVDAARGLRVEVRTGRWGSVPTKQPLQCLVGPWVPVGGEERCGPQ